jgi:hypothetical protein
VRAVFPCPEARRPNRSDLSAPRTAQGRGWRVASATAGTTPAARACGGKRRFSARGMPFSRNKRVADPADLPPSGQVRRPARASAAPIAACPVEDPGLRLGPAFGIRQDGKIAQPRKPCSASRKASFGRCERPGTGVRGLDQRAAETEVSGHELPPGHDRAGKTRLGPPEEPTRARAEPCAERRQPIGP